MTGISPADGETVRTLVRQALAEDIGAGDLTSTAVVPEDHLAGGAVFSRGRYVLAGIEVARLVFAEADPRLAVETRRRDGDRVDEGDEVLRVRGRARSILAAERTALNFLQRLTGVATLTDAFVSRVAAYGVDILDTRKTTPGLRVLEKYAVTCGGGRNHRRGLDDAVLIKDNHRRLWREVGGGGLAAAVTAARGRHPGVSVEIEVETLEELEEAAAGAPDWILLDNMPVAMLAECAARCAGRCRLEASGGITLENVEGVAATGVDAISLGCLTHSAPAADFSLEMGGSA